MPADTQDGPVAACALAGAVFGLMFDHGADPAFVVHRSTRRVLAANAKLAEMLDRDRDGLVGQPLEDLVTAASDRSVPDVLASGGNYEDIAMTRSDGYPVYVTLTVGHILHHAHGALAACIARNMTERRDLERELISKHGALLAAHADLERTVTQLRQATRELEDRNRDIALLAGQVSRFGWRAAVGELCAGVAHYLNNPVGALTSTLRRLATRTDQIADPVVRDELAMLVRRCREITIRIEANVNMVVRVHRSGGADDAPRWLELGHEVDTALSVFGERLDGIVVNRAGPLDVRVRVPHDALHHVLANLIDNSVRAIIPPGTLTLAVDRRANHVAVQVIDSGGGVPPELIGRVFEPIVSARAGGSGLGLSTAQRLARSWGGDVAHIPTSAGACFEVLIPVEELP